MVDAKQVNETPNLEDPVTRIDRELVRLVRLVELAVAQKPGAERLVRSGYLLLGALEADGPLRIAALAEATEVDISTASRQIPPLERQGLVRRLPNPADGRGSLIEITPLGRERLQAARSERLARILELTRDWPESDRAAFAGYLARLNQAITAPGAGVPNAE